MMTARAEHPRLYFDSRQQAELRRLRTEPGHAKIWTNIAESAEWCLSKTPRTNWGPWCPTHQAIVEWSSFGVVSLALLGETTDAQKWVDATVKKFEENLLPTGLAGDGAEVEGATSWASTMHYRIFFMDPLRRV